MEAETTSLADQIHKEIVAEIDRRKDRHFNGLNASWKQLSYRWLHKGSAGFALEWFDDIADRHPDATREVLGILLEERIRMERALHGPQYYTAAHLRGVLAIVKGTYKYDEA